MNREDRVEALKGILVEEIREDLMSRMRKEGMTQAELARRIGKTKGHVNQLMVLRDNMTLGSLVDLAEGIGVRMHFKSAKLSARIREQIDEAMSEKELKDA